MNHISRIAMVVLAALLFGGQAGAGQLIIQAAQDTTKGFVARDIPEQGRRILAWPEGLVSVPDSAIWKTADQQGLAFDFQREDAVAVGAGGRLPLIPGRYSIDTPMLIDDGALRAYLNRGHLTVDQSSIIYRQTAPGLAREGTMLMLAAIGVATAVLLRAVRKRPRRS